ncbi:MAG: LysR family substrate-binding domain-containing protein, partial [Oscillospiraceae bacterium]|nr:LysR family substrate-binding domain-containing protein [Oscillospiraceae bacterium]
ACGWRANFVSAKAQKPQEYFVYFKVFVTQAGAKFAARRARGFIQRFLKGFEKTRLGEMLYEFHIQYPNVRLSLDRENVSELYDGLIQKRYDVVLNLLYSEDTPDEEISYEIIRKYPLLAVLPPYHPLAHRASIERAELKGYPLVDIKHDNRYAELETIRQMFLDSGFLPEVSFISTDIETSLIAVAAGLGYALLPAYVTEHIPGTNVISIPIRGEEALMTVVAAWRTEDMTPAVDSFAQMARKTFRDYIS